MPDFSCFVMTLLYNLNKVKITILLNFLMCSFEVSSLLSNVPLDETVQIGLGKLYALPDPPTMPLSVCL